MYYWSRWTNITSENETGKEREARQSWQETGYRESAKRDTRPVVVVMRRDTQPLSSATTSQRNGSRGQEVSSRISLDIHRARMTSPASLRPAGSMYDITTEDL